MNPNIIYDDFEQGSPEWFTIRRGRPTASAFGRIITSKGKPSDQAHAYANELVAQRLGATDGGWGGNRYADRGTELEPKAREMYEIAEDVDVRQCGFIYNETLLAGGSPDGLVGDDGGLEIKTVSGNTFVEYLKKPTVVPATYLPQVHGLMAVSCRPWWDVFLWAPEISGMRNFLLIRVEADDYTRTLAGAVIVFASKLDTLEQSIRESHDGGTCQMKPLIDEVPEK